MQLDHTEMKVRRWSTRTKAIPRRLIGRYCLMRTSKTIGRERKQTERLIGHAHHVGLVTIPSSLLRIGSVRHLESLHLRDHDWTTDDTDHCIEEVTHGPKREPSFTNTRYPGTRRAIRYCATLGRSRFTI